MSNVSGFDQLHAVRVAGALAHELNNPLQGLLSHLSLINDACAGNEVLRDRLGQLQGGVDRLSNTVRNFSVLYENLPRNPDVIPLSEFVHVVDQEIRRRGFLTSGSATATQQHVLCMFSEIYLLLPEVALGAAACGQLLTWSFETGVGETALRLRCMTQEGDVIWKTLADHDGLSGLPVLLDEMVRLAGGRVEILWQGDSWIGTAIVLKHV